ncbi:MAG: hypothetical protein K0S18_327 [Anaerocolumna sp.]|jgi:hypothetical protein|nr:hypothetical protein [Bacillales bacterium]MDF2950744.1 hypothetical protein [Anaerocolumna sp.]
MYVKIYVVVDLMPIFTKSNYSFLYFEYQIGGVLGGR